MTDFPIIRGIDVGYGNTKFTTTDSTGKEIGCGMFPSVAPMAGRQDIEGFGDKKETVRIEVHGQVYEVGPDAMLGMASNSTRNLDVEFPTRDTYLALARGAMYYMNVPHIDLLVVGLPVSNLEGMAKVLEARLLGVHSIPAFGATDGKTTRALHVNKVMVVAQPVGGLLDYSVRNGLIRKMQSGNTLILDPGYFTMDWVVSAGFKIVGIRSSAANNAGMAAIIRSVAERLMTKLKQRDHRPMEITEPMLQRVDEALRGDHQIRINGRMETVSDCLAGAEGVIQDALTAMRAKVGTLTDIDRVILVGGAAKLYSEAVQKMFTGYDVIVASDSVFSNVRGFQMYGETKFREPSEKPERPSNELATA